MRVEVVMTYFIQGQNQKSMFIKLHEGDDNNEVKKKETIESDITHEKKSKNDETEVKSNGKRIRKANRNINGRVEYDQYNPNLKKMKIISGKDGAENCYRPAQSKSQC